MLGHRFRLSMRPGPARGAALLVTVLVATLGASIVLALTMIASADLRAGSSSADAAAARDQVQAALTAYRAELAQDPYAFLSSVSSLERARVCIADPAPLGSDPVYQPGAAWPAACGTAWEYTNPAEGASQLYRIEVTPPSSGSNGGALIVKAVARNAASGDQQAAASMTLAQSSATAWTLMVDGDLDLSGSSPPDLESRNPSLGTHPPSLLPSASASYYAGGTVTGPPNGQWGASGTPTSALVVGEEGVSGVTAGANVRVAVPAPATGSGQEDVRDVVPTPLRTADLRADAEAARLAGCPGDTSTPTNRATTTSATTSRLCLAPGAQLVTTSNTLVSVPDSALAFSLWPTTVNALPALRISVSSIAPSAPISGDLRADSLESIAAGTHPGAASYWTALGTFYLPDSGVVAAPTADIHLGLCGAAFASGTAPCDRATLSGALTAVAGSSDAPRDIYLAGPLITSGSARLGAVAFGDLVIPYWAQPAGAGLDLAVHGVALGGGPPPLGAARSGAVHTLPLARPSPTAAGGRLSITGSLAAPSIGLSPAAAAQFSAVVVTPRVESATAPPPYFPSFTGAWSPVKVQALAPSTLCADPCATFFGGSGTATSPTTTPPSSIPTPPTPSAPTLVASDGRLTATWAPPTTGTAPASYALSVTELLSGQTDSKALSASSCSATSCSLALSGLTNGRRYSVTVAAISAGGGRSPASASSVGIPNALPGAPTALSARVAQVSQIDLAWTAPSSGAEAYLVSRNGAVVARTTTPYWSDGSVTVGGTYSYQVAAVNSAGTGPQSSSVSATAQLVAQPPPSVTAAPVNGSAGLKVSWSTPPTVYSGFRITYSTSANPTGAPYIEVTGPGQSATVNGLVANTAYTVWVQTIPAASTALSSYSPSASAITAPAAPTALAAPRQGTTNVDVTWAPPVAAVSYEVYISTSTIMPATPATTTTVASATLSGLTALTSYRVWVVARNAAGAASPASSPLTITTAPSAPPAPTVKGVAASPVSLDVSWPAVTGATSYDLYVSTGTVFPGGAPAANVTATSARLSSLVPATVHWVWLAVRTSASTQSDPSPPGRGLTVPGAPLPLMGESVSGSTTSVRLRWTPPVSYAGAVMSDGPDAYYRLNETSGASAADGSGNNRRGTYSGTGYTLGRPGAIVGDATTALGVTAGSSLALPASLNPWAGAFSIELWVKGQSWSGYQSLVSKETYLSNGFRMGLRDGRPAFWTSQSGGSIDVVAPSALSLDAWHHVVVSVTGADSVDLFVDGFEVAQGSGSFIRPVSGGGSAGSCCDIPLAADLDEVAVYPGVLAPSRIAAHYALGTATGTASDWGILVSDYAIYRSTTTTFPTGSTPTIATGTTATITGLTANTVYTFWVAARNASGESPTASVSRSAATLPARAADPIPSVAAGSGVMAINFVEPDPNTAASGWDSMVSYTATQSQLNKTCTAPASVKPVRCTISGLTPGTKYTFTATMTNSIGTSQASTPSVGVVAARPPTAPAPPTLVTGSRAVRASWTNLTDATDPAGFTAISSYTVTVSPGGTTCTSPQGAAGAANSCAVSGLTAGTIYTATLSASNAAGTSSPSSASAAITAAAAPLAPTGMTQSGGDASSSTFTLTAPWDMITGYQVSTDNGSTWCTASGTGPVTVTTVSSACGVTNLSAGTTWSSVKVRGLNGATPGAPSIAFSMSTAPGPPTVSSTSTSTQITASFSAPAVSPVGGGSAAAVTGYQYSTDGGTTWCPLGSTLSPQSFSTSSAPGCTTPLTRSVTYSVALRAGNLLTSLPVPAWGTTSAGVAQALVPATPAGLAAASRSASIIDLGWDAATGADSYRVARFADTGGAPGALIATSDVSACATTGSTTRLCWSDTGLTSATTRWYAVSALATNAASPNSAQVGMTSDGSSTFGFATSTRTFTVPVGVTGVVVKVTGGSGGTASTTLANSGVTGRGGTAFTLRAATSGLTPGTSWWMCTGGGGGAPTAGFNGGGAGFSVTGLASGGGGGPSDIRLPSGNTCGSAPTTTPLLVVPGAGGGGAVAAPSGWTSGDGGSATSVPGPPMTGGKGGSGTCVVAGTVTTIFPGGDGGSGGVGGAPGPDDVATCGSRFSGNTPGLVGGAWVGGTGVQGGGGGGGGYGGGGGGGGGADGSGYRLGAGGGAGGGLLSSGWSYLSSRTDIGAIDGYIVVCWGPTTTTCN